MKFNARLALPVVFACVAGSQALHAELRFVSRVEVKAQRPRDPGFVASMFAKFLPFNLAPGKTDIVTRVPADAILISEAGGRTLCLLPSTGTYFVMTSVMPVIIEAVFKPERQVRRRGASDTLLGHRSQRVTESIKVFPQQPLPDVVYRNGQPVEGWTLDETSEQRTARYLYSNRSMKTQWAEVPISIDSWTTDAFGEAGRTAAAAGTSITTLATAGVADPAPRDFALRQVIVSPTGGYTVESRVTSAVAEPVTDDVFVVPADYRLVPDPRMRPMPSKVR
jgi:hypothetical protein